MKTLHTDLTKEYFLAREQIPDIVDIESDPVKYLRVEDGNAGRAATRIAMYWKKRRHYFGEKWMLPMHQTEGTGALSSEDIQVLRSGYVVIVTMHSGQQIFMIDPSRLNGRDPGESRERCLFYLCTNEVKFTSEQSGLEMIFLLSRYGYASERHTEFIDVLYNAMPTKVRHLTILQSMQEGKVELLDFLSFRLERTFAMFTPTRVTVVKVDSRQTVVDALQRRGIHRRYLPKQLGGDYDYSKLEEWVQTRLAVEKGMLAAIPRRNALPTSLRRRSSRSIRLSKETRMRAVSALNSPGSCSIASLLLRDLEQKRASHRRKKHVVRKSKRQQGTNYLDIVFENCSESLTGSDGTIQEMLSSAISECSSNMSL
jgi:hypothetical protein